MLKNVNPPSTTTNATAADSGSTMGTQKKSLGPLTIHNVGLQVKDSHVFILIDAGVLLGAIQLSFEGFGIGLPLSKIIHHLSLSN